MTFSARYAASGALLALLVAHGGCARNVAVGHEDALEAVGGEPGVSGAPGAGGEPVAGGAPAAGAAGAETSGGNANGGEPGGALLWSADHEVNSFDEWLGDGQGIRYEQGTGRLELTSELAHSGTHAFTATLTTGDDELHQAVMGRDIQLQEGRYGAWFLLPEAPRADYWVIMKLSSGSGADRFDLDIEAREGAPAYLRLFQHPNMWITEPASVELPIGRWVHIEILYRSTPNADGRVLVLQDGQQVLDSGPRVTASDDRVRFYCGSVSRSVTPSPFSLFIDDVSIHAATLP